jgi:antitoxin component of RelBE/YafQ-DinJ toxin-antitoxin module
MVSVRVPEELLLRLAEVGNEEGLAMSDTIRLVLERGLNKGRGKKP